ncbi:MAG: hypothetical protein KDI18_16175, partial [Gammaproteobacteria bacterium]|nr:hypothetical protein [Gammaproteobacteria bacterium]
MLELPTAIAGARIVASSLCHHAPCPQAMVKIYCRTFRQLRSDVNDNKGCGVRVSQQLNWKFENWPMFQSTGLKIPSLTPISYSEKADLASRTYLIIP